MAIWDEFLSERDRQHLASGWQKKAPFGLGRRPAVLVIDNQQGIVGDEELPLLEAMKHGIARCGLEGWTAIRQTRSLLDTARKVGVPVIYTLNGGGASGSNLVLTADHLTGTDVNETGDMDPEKVKAEIHRDIPPHPGDMILRKGSASAFFLTPLVAHLIAMKVDTLLVCGNSTSGCVRSTVIDGSAYQFRMGVVEDCTFDRTQASHALNLFDMNQKYSDVISLDDALQYLTGPLDLD